MISSNFLALTAIATVFIVIGGAALVLIVWVIGIFNALVAMRNRVKNAWAQIDVQLKRRYDLIPNHEEQGVGKIARSSAVMKVYLTAIMVGSFFVDDPSTGPVHLNHAVSKRHP